jgi:hypothetical protein
MEFLLAGGVILGIAAILGVLFYFMYHTFHGDLPNFMIIVVSVFIGIAAVLGVIGVVSLLI